MARPTRLPRTKVNVRTRIHTARPGRQAHQKLTQMANDRHLDRKVRQKAANLLLSASIPHSVSDGEVKAFIQELVTEMETKAHADH